MAGDEAGRHTHLVQQCAETEAQRLHAHQVELLPEQPARIVFAKAGGFYQSSRFILERIRDEGLRGFLKHETSRAGAIKNKDTPFAG